MSPGLEYHITTTTRSGNHRVISMPAERIQQVRKGIRKKAKRMNNNNNNNKTKNNKKKKQQSSSDKGTFGLLRVVLPPRRQSALTTDSSSSSSDKKKKKKSAEEGVATNRATNNNNKKPSPKKKKTTASKKDTVTMKHHLLRDARIDIKKHPRVMVSGRGGGGGGRNHQHNKAFSLRHHPKHSARMDSNKKMKAKNSKNKTNNNVQLTGNLVSWNKVPWHQGVEASASFKKEEERTPTPTTTTAHQEDPPIPSSLPSSLINFPTGNISEHMLSRLDQELQHFASYVRLTPCECDAREYVIQCLANLAGQVFGGTSSYSKSCKKNKNGNSSSRKRKRQDSSSTSASVSSRNNNNDDGVCLQAFGSYATQSVCMFSSDVDLVLWGVVPTSGRHTRFDAKEDEEDEEDHCEAVKALRSHEKQAASLRETRVQKWREALAELEAAASERAVTRDDDEVKVNGDDEDDDDDNAAAAGALSVAETDSETHPLFVLDYTGTAAAMKDACADDAPTAAAPSRTNQNAVAVAAVDSSAALPLVVDDGSNENDNNNDDDDDDDDQEDSNDGPEVINLLSEDSDEDTADKLESLGTKPQHVDSSAQANLAHATVSLSPSGTDEDDQDSGSEEMDKESDCQQPYVSYVSQANPGPVATVGPTGYIRKLVVNGLYALARAMRKDSLFHSIEVRRNAKVPIVTAVSQAGFETDIAVGGHNGTDTSAYAASQAKRYKSFAPVVLFLKELLNQQSLDKPFTGGLGSYKLYVLVAYHLEQYLGLGGNDRPSEVLISFLFRFGNLDRKLVAASQSGSSSADFTTRLSQTVVLHTRDGSADLQPVYRIDECCRAFELSWSRFMAHMEDEEKKHFNATTTHSLLALIVDAERLRRNRDLCSKRAKQLHSRKSTTAWPRRQAHQKNSQAAAGALEGQVVARPSLLNDREEEAIDLEADQLVAGYGMKLARGGDLIQTSQR